MNKPENTAIPRKTGSKPLKDAIKRRWVRAGDRILDFACGRGADIAWLKSEGYDVAGFDPHEPFGWSSAPTGHFDIVNVIYLVNVLDDAQARRVALERAWAYVRPGGWMMVVARTDREINAQAAAKGWPSWRDGYWSNRTRGMFQRGHSVDDLRALVGPLSPAKIDASRVSAYSAIRAQKPQ